MSTASSSASCAMSRNSCRFSLSTLIFSTQETGSPSGVFHVGSASFPAFALSLMRSLYSARGLLWRRFAAVLLLRRAALTIDELPDQRFKADRRLGVLDHASRLDRLVIGTRYDRQIFVAEQTARRDRRHRIGRQLDR